MTAAAFRVLALTAVCCATAWSQSKPPPRVNAFVLPGDRVIPQVATGGDSFFMKFQMKNLTDQAATIEISFFDDAGLPLSVPYVQDGAQVTGTMLTDTVAPNGIEFAQTQLSGPILIGYALVSSTPPLSVAVSAAFNQVISGRPLFQAFVPLASDLHDRFSIPVLNTGGFTASIAVVTTAAQQLTFIARNQSGVELCRDTRMFAAGEHQAFIVRDRLPCTAAADGSLDVVGQQVGLAGFGLTAQDAGAFVTQPVYGPIPAGPVF